MSRLAAVLVIAALLMVQASSPEPSGAAPTQPSVSDQIPVSTTTTAPVVAVTPDDSHGLVPTDELTPATIEALGLFESLGLDVGPISFTYPDTCPVGRDGVGSYYSELHLACVASDAPDWVVVHEIAHAWVSHNFTQADREAYLAYTGLDTWNSSSYDWNERGTERAAFIIQNTLAGGVPGPEGERRRAEFVFLIGLGTETNYG